MSTVNYFEVLLLKGDPAAVTDEMVAESKEKARMHWQGLVNQGIDAQQTQQAKRYKGLVEEAYNTLINVDSRKRYIEELNRSKDRVSAESLGQIEVKFSLGGKHNNLNFSVVENPVAHPLILSSDMTIRSVQEYVCRAWEIPKEIGVPQLEDRSLERWLYYSAREPDIANIIRYYQWRPDDISDEQILFMTLDLLQARYPAPIIPRSEPEILEKIKDMTKPQWLVSPSVVNFGFLSGGRNTVTLSVKTWRRPPGKLTAVSDNPLIKLDIARLESKGLLTVEINGADVKGGDSIQGSLTITSENFGEKKVSVYGVRMKWLGIKMFNQGLVKDHTTRVAIQAKELGEYDYAAELYRELGAKDEARDSEYRSLGRSYREHQWLVVIDKARQFQTRYARHPKISAMLVEALRMVAGAYYQLKQDQSALPLLATLALESAYLPDGKLPEDNWTRKSEAQIHIDPDKPKHAWVEVAEKLDLRWTHPSGTADKSHFAGDRPVDLRERILYWRSKVACRTPLVAYLGIIVARRKDNKAMVGLDAASGEVVWTHTPERTGGREYSEPVCGQNNVFFTDPNGVLFALDIQTGTVRWQRQLENVRDLQLAYMDGKVIAATGQEVIIINAAKNEIEGSTGKLRGMFAGANPVNLLISAECVLFQKATMFKKTMNFIDTVSSQNLEFNIPFGVAPPVAWAAYEGELYIPFLLKYSARCPTRIRTYSDGRQETEYETVHWDELSMGIYNVRSTQPVGELQSPIPGKTFYNVTNQCDVKTSYQTADIVAMAPVSVQRTGGNTIVSPYDPGGPLHFIIAAAFGRDIYYWLRLDDSIEIANYRQADSKVQSIIFADIQDIVISERSFSAALIGQQGGDFGATWPIPSQLGSIVGTPALYGDVIYVIAQSGDVVAIGK